MNKRTRVLLVIAVLLILCGSASLFSYFYLNKKMAADILSIAKNSVVIETQNEETELETESTQSDTSQAEYMDALNGEFADIGKDQEVKEVKRYADVLEIPQYDILAHIYPDVSRTSLAYGVGHYPQTTEVGEKGNCAIAGHSSVIYDCILNEVKNMHIMDSFNVYDKKGKKHIYYVSSITVVEPTDMYVLDTTDRDRSEFTIVTCTNGGKQRLVINSFEMTEEEIEKAKKEKEEGKLSFMQSLIKNYQTDIADINSIYSHNYSDDVTAIIDDEYKAGSLVRYLLKSTDLKNKHNVYSYSIDLIVKEEVIK